MNFVANFWASRKKRNIVFRNEGGEGGSEAVWKFSENSSKMVHAIVPKGQRSLIRLICHKEQKHNFFFQLDNNHNYDFQEDLEKIKFSLLVKSACV